MIRLGIAPAMNATTGHARGRTEAHHVKNRDTIALVPAASHRAERVHVIRAAEQRLGESAAGARVGQLHAERRRAQHVVVPGSRDSDDSVCRVDADVGPGFGPTCPGSPSRRYGRVVVRFQGAEDPIVLDDDLVIAGENAGVLAKLPEARSI